PPSGVAVAEAGWALERYAVAVRTAFETVDVLALATTPGPAPSIGQAMVGFAGAEMPTIFALSLHTMPLNVAPGPALRVPCGAAPGGLPIGLQLVGRPFDEAVLLRVGHAYERATAWHKRRPALA